MTKSPIAEHYKETQSVCADHFIRALYAGGASIVFGDNIDWLEVECIAKGDKNCKFVFGPREALLRQYPEYAYQIK
jgi:predicted hydrocarbon binding protein